MSDNTQLNPGIGGDIVSTDDLGGGVKVQRVKAQFGADGAASDVETTNPMPCSLHDPADGEASRVTNGGLDINVQDQHTKPFDVFFQQIIATGITLAIDAVINAYSVNFTTGHGIQVGDQIVLYDTVSARLYVGTVLVSGTNVVEFDMPLNFSFLAASSIATRTTRELNVDGSGTRQTFKVSPPINVEVDITRIMIQIITTTAPDMGDFGDISGGLDKGIAVRAVNSENINLFNAKTNGDLANLMYDLQFYEATKFGVYGVAGRMTYAGQDKHGVTIRLGLDENLEVIIQDNLTSLVSFRMIAAGHIVE